VTGMLSDLKKNKSEQALQIIGHVVAESYANKHELRQFGLKRHFIINQNL
jgi:hypothetical protein